MNLQEFITETLFQIQKGINDAQDKLKAEDVRGVVSPSWGNTEEHFRKNLREIEFDVAVTVTEKGAKEAGGGLQIPYLNASGKKSSASEDSHTSRIKFAIPFIPPSMGVVNE